MAAKLTLWRPSDGKVPIYVHGCCPIRTAFRPQTKPREASQERFALRVRARDAVLLSTGRSNAAVLAAKPPEGGFVACVQQLQKAHRRRGFNISTATECERKEQAAREPTRRSLLYVPTLRFKGRARLCTFAKASHYDFPIPFVLCGRHLSVQHLMLQWQWKSDHVPARRRPGYRGSCPAHHCGVVAIILWIDCAKPVSPSCMRPCKFWMASRSAALPHAQAWTDPYQFCSTQWHVSMIRSGRSSRCSTSLPVKRTWHQFILQAHGSMVDMMATDCKDIATGTVHCVKHGSARPLPNADVLVASTRCIDLS